HFEPAAMRRLDRPHDDIVAAGAPENGAHWSGIEMQRADGSLGAAVPAFNLRGCYVQHEKLLKQSCCRIAIQNEVRAVFRHGAYPPEGPKRSVLMERG